MNFNVYEINKIFDNNIGYLWYPERYGFQQWGRCDDPQYGTYYDIYFDIKNQKESNWVHRPGIFDKYFSLKDSRYQIDRNYIVHRSPCGFALTIEGNSIHVSLRELILFMMYLKHLHSLCIE